MMHGYDIASHDIANIAPSRDRAIFAISHRRTPTRSSIDNDECHVTAFRPISEAAYSWSYGRG